MKNKNYNFKNLEKVYLNFLKIYNVMNEIASMIGPKFINKCQQLNKKLNGLLTFIKQNFYLIKDPDVEFILEDLIEIAEDYYETVKYFDPKAEDNMETRLYLVMISQMYGKEIIDMYQQNLFPDYLYENFNFRQKGRIIIGLDYNHYEKK